MLDPCSTSDEGVRRSGLLWIIPDDEPDQDVGVNGAHGGS
jgi:hypothetical protein